MPVKFSQTIVRLWFFLSYLITDVKNLRWAKFLWPSHNIRTLTWTLKPRCSKWRYEGSPLWVAVDLYLLRFAFLTFQMPRLPEII